MTDPVISLLYSPTDFESNRLYSQLFQHGLIETEPQILYKMGTSNKIIPVDVSSSLIKQKISSCSPHLNIPCIIIKDPQNQQKHIFSRGELYSWVAKVIKKKEEISASKLREDVARKEYMETHPENKEAFSSATDPDIEDEVYEPQFMTMSAPRNFTASQQAPTIQIPRQPMPQAQQAPQPHQTPMVPVQSQSSPPPLNVTRLPPLPDNADPETLRQESLRRQKEIQSAIDERRKAMKENAKPLNAREIMAKYQQETK